MEALLRCYAEEDAATGGGGGGGRKIIRVEGAPVTAPLLERLLTEMRSWSGSLTRNRRERPSIKAESYMILRSPSDFAGHEHSAKATLAAAKLKENAQLWELAQLAMLQVDTAFAEQYTAVAFTYNFEGSPHIDKQNTGPFYGLSLGDFPEGQGGIRVECSPRLVAEVNTRHRLGKVDGRYPHWVAPYKAGAERYSVIYYMTAGAFAEPGPAVFSLPLQYSRSDDDCASKEDEEEHARQ